MQELEKIINGLKNQLINQEEQFNEKIKKNKKHFDGELEKI